MGERAQARVADERQMALRPPATATRLNCDLYPQVVLMVMLTRKMPASSLFSDEAPRGAYSNRDALNTFCDFWTFHFKFMNLRWTSNSKLLISLDNFGLRGEVVDLS